MRIKRDEKDSTALNEQFILWIALRAPQCRVPLRTEAMIDTGSPYYLLLSYKEAIRSQFPLNRFEPEEIIPIGGGKIEAYKVSGATIHMRDSAEGLVTLKPDAIYFSSPTSKREERTIETYSMPNLLGVDFLELNKFRFVFDPAKNEAYLEREENQTSQATI